MGALIASAAAAAVNLRRFFTGETALHYAAAQGLTQTCALLVGREDFVGMHARGLDGMTALHYATVRGHTTTCQALLSARANPELGDVHGRTAWDVASARGYDLIGSAHIRE